MENNFANVYERAGYYMLEYQKQANYTVEALEKVSALLNEWYKILLNDNKPYEDNQEEWKLYERIEQEYIYNDYTIETIITSIDDIDEACAADKKLDELIEQYLVNKGNISYAYEESKRRAI